MAMCTVTATWQFPTLPRVPEYCRATQAEAVPSFLNPVSSITHASGVIVSSAMAARRRRTGSTFHGEEETNCCSCWWSTSRRSAIGCIDFRRPSSISPCRYSRPFARWSFRPSEANTVSAKSSSATRRPVPFTSTNTKLTGPVSD